MYKHQTEIDADNEMKREHVMTLIGNLVDKEVRWAGVKRSEMLPLQWDIYHNAITIAKDRIRTALRELT